MRCFACDRPNSTHFDGETERHYCTTCWNVIEDAIGLTKDDDYVTIEELMEEEHGIRDGIEEGLTTNKDASGLPQVWS